MTFGGSPARRKCHGRLKRNHLSVPLLYLHNIGAMFEKVLSDNYGIIKELLRNPVWKFRVYVGQSHSVWRPDCKIQYVWHLFGICLATNPLDVTNPLDATNLHRFGICSATNPLDAINRHTILLAEDAAGTESRNCCGCY